METIHIIPNLTQEQKERCREVLDKNSLSDARAILADSPPRTNPERISIIQTRVFPYAGSYPGDRAVFHLNSERVAAASLPARTIQPKSGS